MVYSRAAENGLFYPYIDLKQPSYSMSKYIVK